MSRRHVSIGLEEFLKSIDSQNSSLTDDQKSIINEITLGSRVGLICHPASIDKAYRHSSLLLFEHPKVNLKALFGPQHGIFGEKQDNMIESASFFDDHRQIPVYSLYGDHRKPTTDMLKDIDILLFDIQDVGCRVYTFIWTMALAMEKCAELGKKCVVLSRPNPIGNHISGNLLDNDLKSFVGLYSIPMQHGMTTGQMARHLNAAHGIDCNLVVFECRIEDVLEGDLYFNKPVFYDEIDFPWVMPSPNMPTLDTAIVYPGMVLFEGTMLSEGRGTTKPFELFGAPYINNEILKKEMDLQHLPGIIFRAVFFQPTFHKFAGEVCQGLFLHVTDRTLFEPYYTALVLLKTLIKLYPESFKWRQPPYEYEFEKLPIDLLIGSKVIRQKIESNCSNEELKELATFQ